jgi:orotate phosphoribosyltransferase
MIDKNDFIRFLIDADALRFGDFMLKSGRRSPYFINAGAFDTGAKLARLGSFYAARVREAMDAREIPEEIDTIFGPAYKGIPLATATAAALAGDFGMDTGYAFNRKEIKDHGEGGGFVGRRMKNGDRIVIVDDVITAGSAIRETLPLIRAEADVAICGLVIAVDRMERGGSAAPDGKPAGLSAAEEIRTRLGVPVFPIATIGDILEAAPRITFGGRPVMDRDTRIRMAAYMSEYCEGGAGG